MDAERFVSVVGTTADEEINKVVVEQRELIEETPRHLYEVPQQAMADRDDDWFVLLDVPREMAFAPQGIVEILCSGSQIYQSKYLKSVSFSKSPVVSIASEHLYLFFS